MSPAHTNTDCLVIGAGPAGLSAARWLDSLEVPFRWVSHDARVGGMLRRVSNAITNYPGGCYASGAELAAAFEAYLDECGDVGERLESGAVESLERVEDHWQVHLDDDRVVSARAVVLATGTKYRRLGVPGEDAGMGECVSQSATADAQRFAGQPVAVVGGGDAGFENALVLAEHGCQVFMLLRSPEFRARPAFVERATAHDHIELYPIPTRVHAISPSTDGCTLQLDVQGSQQTLSVACLFVRIGVEPLLPTIEPTPSAKDGFLLVDDHQMTDADALFAAGDVTACVLRSVATAVGTGATAARSVARHLGYL